MYEDHDGDQDKIIAWKPLTFILNLKIVMGSKKKEAKVKIIFSLTQNIIRYKT